MYFNDDPKVTLMDIMIHQAVVSYEPWLARFSGFYWNRNKPINLGKISLPLPDSWPRPEKVADTPLPEWAQKDYTFEELSRKIEPSVPRALRDLGRPNEGRFEAELMKHGAMTLYVMEGLRLHLMTAAAFSAYHNKKPGITGDDVIQVAGWKCWAWPWC